MIIKFLKQLKACYLNSIKKYPITLYPESKFRGRVLFSYLADPLLLKKTDARFLKHSNSWESVTIAKIFTELGFIVDAINYNDLSFYPTQNYDIVFDIGHNLQRLMPFVPKNSLKLLHITGSYPRYSVAAELARVNEFEIKKNSYYSPKRTFDVELFDRSLKFADYCSLIGNDFVLNTFPKNYYDKITKVTVSASKLNYIKNINEYLPYQKEFIWFFGGGAVHKGLDLVIDFFIQNKNLKLNIVGNVESEKDFFNIYEQELLNSKNIKYHGFLNPSSQEFIDIIKRSFCFIAPSCSEGISPSVATLLQVGLYPIISKNTGIDLPKDSGIYLDNLSVQAIKDAILKVNNLSVQDIKLQIKSCQEMALKKYSQENFYNEIKKFIITCLTKKGLL